MKLLQDAGDAVREKTLTGTNVGMGTPDFMSPEQFSPHAAVDGRADQHALAVTVYEMLCGSKPFAGLSQAPLPGVFEHPEVAADGGRENGQMSTLSECDECRHRSWRSMAGT